MPLAGYYKTNYRALRFRECARMWGRQRGLRNYFETRFMRPSRGGVWMPGLWAENECRKEDLSEEFWLATKPHRKDFEELGFIQCRLAKGKTLNPRVRDSGLIGYLDSTRRYFGQIHYIKVLRASNRQENEIHIKFTAMFEDGSVSCTNNKKSFDTFDESDVTYLDSFDVKFIHQQFLQRLQQRKDTPRQFQDIESLREWFDARQHRTFEERTRRRLYLPMSDAEVAAAQARLQSGAPPIQAPQKRVSPPWLLWVIIIACVLALQVLRNGLHSRSSDTMEYRGQQFKMSKAYPTYEDYKDDPNNLDTNELDRIEQVITNAPVPATFKDRKEFIHSMIFDLDFPGYGVGGLGTLPQTDDGSALDAEMVEIPQRNKERVIVVRGTTGPLNLIDDFVYSTTTNEVNAVKLEKQTLRYYDSQNRLLREKHL